MTMSNEHLFGASNLPEFAGFSSYRTELQPGDTVQLRNGLEYLITEYNPQTTYCWYGQATVHGSGYENLTWTEEGKRYAWHSHHLDIIKIVHRPRPKKEPAVYDLRSCENFLTSLTMGQRQALDAYYVRKDEANIASSLGEEGSASYVDSIGVEHKNAPGPSIEERAEAFEESETERMEALFSKKIVDATLGDLMEVLRNYQHPEDV